MTNETKLRIADSVRDFSLPQYSEIPAVGLYLEQVTKYICEYLAPLQENAITGSMISNYVKKGLVTSPVKKQYSRDQIAKLMFIALAKTVLSLDDLALFLRLQERTYSTEKAYTYFCLEFENMLRFFFGLSGEIQEVGEDTTDEKYMLQGTIAAVTQKIYLEKCFAAIAAEEALSQAV